MLTFFITMAPLFFFFSKIVISFSSFCSAFVFFFCRKILISFTCFLLESFFVFLIIHIYHFYIYKKYIKIPLLAFYMSYISIFLFLFFHHIFLTITFFVRILFIRIFFIGIFFIRISSIRSRRNFYTVSNILRNLFPLYHNGKCIICKNNTLMSRSVTNDARNYHQFCTMFGLKQIIKLTHITSRNTSLIDHILASIPSQVSQHGVIHVSVFDHQLICCTRKINKIKTVYAHKHNFSLV